MLFLPIIFSLNAINAQDGYQLGARNSALSGATLTIGDAWATFNNVGAIGNLENSTGAITYQNRYNIPEFMVLGGSFIQVSKWVNTGLSFYRFGDNLFNEQKAGLSIGNKIQMVSLGAGANLLQYKIKGLDTWQYWVFEFGGVAQLSEQLFIGAHIFNISVDTEVPVIMKAGISYQPLSDLMINIETHKSVDANARLVTGIEYYLIRSLALRSGFSTNPFKSAYGLGIVLNLFDFNYAFSSQSDLGSIHEISLNFSLRVK